MYDIEYTTVILNWVISENLYYKIFHIFRLKLVVIHVILKMTG